MQNLHTLSFHTRGNNSRSNQWPELCQKNQIKHSVDRKELTSFRESTEIIQLDDTEYPELGTTVFRNRCPAIATGSGLSNSTGNALIPNQINMESRKSKRYKRPDKMCIILKEALQYTKHVHKLKHKEVPRKQINIHVENVNVAVSTDKNCSDIRKFKIFLSKQEKLSRLKKVILESRNIRAQINAQKRQDFEREKMEAISRDVNSIDFRALEINRDPEMDVNCVRDMSQMTLYNKDYRDKNEENISEETVCFRPDIIEQIDNLHVQRQNVPIANAQRPPVNVNHAAFSNVEKNVTASEIIQQTLSLQIKDDIKQEIQNNIKIENVDSIIFSRNFREYCTNMLTSGLNKSLEKFLQEISRLQKKYHEKYPNKSKYKRRYYSGLKEVQKHARLMRLKFVIIAPDIEKVDLKDGLYDHVDKLLDTCKRQNVVYCFGLKQRQLGYYAFGKGQACCVGITDYTGIEELFKDVLIELVRAREIFKNLSGKTGMSVDVSKLIAEDFLPSESVKTLLKVLSTGTFQT